MNNYPHNNSNITLNLEKEVDVFAVDADVQPKPYLLSIDTLNSLQELGEILRGIHKRMTAEGYELKDGTIRKKIC